MQIGGIHQAAALMMTFDDAAKGERRVILSQDDARWKLDHADRVHQGPYPCMFPGGNVDEDEAHKTGAPLDLLRHAGVKDGVETAAALAAFRETREEMGIDALPYLLRPDASLRLAHTIRKRHDDRSGTDVRIFHLHLGALNETEIASLRDSLEPHDDTISAGDVAVSQIVKQGQGYVARGYQAHRKLRYDWEPIPWEEWNTTENRAALYRQMNESRYRAPFRFLNVNEILRHDPPVVASNAELIISLREHGQEQEAAVSSPAKTGRGR